MTYTRTYTLEERALDALCSGAQVTLGLSPEPVVGRIIAIHATDDPTERRVVLRTSAGLDHTFKLEHGLVEW